MPALTIDAVPDHMTADEFWKFFGDMEHERLDFKLQPGGLKEAFAAMAMTDGGMVVIGVRDRPRRVEGFHPDQADMDGITAVGHDCGVAVVIRTVEVDRTKIVVVAVPAIRGRIVTTPDGRLLRRVGASNRPLVGEQLGRFVREHEMRPAEEDRLAQLRPDDLDLDLVNTALNAHRRLRGRKRISSADAFRALADLGVATIDGGPVGIVPMKAAAVLFAGDPTSFIPGASVQAVRRVGVGPGPGASRQRVEIKGPLPAVLADTLDFIDRHSPHYQATIGTHRERLPAYPPEVLREALLNALAHRDYGLAGATVDVTVWDDRLEIRSPGPLPGHITVDNMRDEHYSRNRRLMVVLKALRLVEEYGEGVDLMIREMESRLMDPPLFIATESSLTVTLYSRSSLRVEDQAWLALLGRLEMTAHERQALVLAHRFGGITPRMLRRLVPQLNPVAVLSSAVAKGLLTRVGERGGSQYVLSPEVVVRAGASGVEARSRKRQMLLDEIRRRGWLSTADAKEFLGEADTNFVRSLLSDLVRSRLVTAVGRTRARRYVPR